jgi:hypothetical protein
MCDAHMYTRQKEEERHLIEFNIWSELHANAITIALLFEDLVPRLPYSSPETYKKIEIKQWRMWASPKLTGRSTECFSNSAHVLLLCIPAFLRNRFVFGSACNRLSTCAAGRKNSIETRH